MPFKQHVCGESPIRSCSRWAKPHLGVGRGCSIHDGLLHEVYHVSCVLRLLMELMYIYIYIHTLQIQKFERKPILLGWNQKMSHVILGSLLHCDTTHQILPGPAKRLCIGQRCAVLWASNLFLSAIQVLLKIQDCKYLTLSILLLEIQHQLWLVTRGCYRAIYQVVQGSQPSTVSCLDHIKS